MTWAFSTLFSKLARGAHSVSQGAESGLIVVILLGFESGLINHSTSNLLDMTGTLANGVTYIVFYIIMEILASGVYSKVTD
jgi:hypothetical protein